MIYEYRCISCNHRWEAEQKLEDKPLTHCPACKAKAAKKLISRTTFMLKGSGWTPKGF